MRIPARVLKDEPILVDRAANYFGTAGQVFMIRAKIRCNGTLTLTEDLLTFEQIDSDTVIEIPIEEIQRLGMGRWHEITGSFVPVLKITYRGNLVFGVHVANPEKWIEAVEAVASRHDMRSLNRPARDPRTVFRLSRLVIAGFVILLILSMALPMFFSWVQNTTMQSQLSSPSPANPGSANP